MDVKINKEDYLKHKKQITSNTFLKWDNKKQTYLVMDKKEQQNYSIIKIDNSNIDTIDFLISVLNQWSEIYKKNHGTVKTYEDVTVISLVILSVIEENNQVFVYLKGDIKDKKIDNIFGIAISEQKNENNAVMLTNITNPNSQLEHKERPNGTIGAIGSNIRHHMINFLFEELRISNIISTAISDKAAKGLLKIGFKKL